MTVYVLAEISIHDRARYETYVSGFMDVLTRYSGRLLAADERPLLIEGGWQHEKVILLEFDDGTAAQAWMQSPEYQAIAADRVASSAGMVLLVRGVGRNR